MIDPRRGPFIDEIGGGAGIQFRQMSSSGDGPLENKAAHNEGASDKTKPIFVPTLRANSSERPGAQSKSRANLCASRTSSLVDLLRWIASLV